MPDVTIIKADDVKRIARGSGIVTVPLITKHSAANAQFTTGMSTYPAGEGAPMHWHNCDEQVTLIDGTGEVEVKGTITQLKRHDSTYIPANEPHCFRNTGTGPMTILWVYSSSHVTRTFASNGMEVEHLSATDLMGTPERP
jgi:mannose-6-phosphate isomerase-like protein (cupin superfamily)